MQRQRLIRLFTTETLQNPVKIVAFEGENIEDDFNGIASEPFNEDIRKILAEPICKDDIEIKPDGMIYLPEIKYRRILNKAFGPGGWGLVPRGPHTIIENTLTREYALYCSSRFVSQARGEQDFFKPSGLATASEGCKSNALMRCCKDLGIASELWDPSFIRAFKNEHLDYVQGVHVMNGSKKWIWRRKNTTLEYPYKEEVKSASSTQRVYSRPSSTK